MCNRPVRSATMRSLATLACAGTLFAAGAAQAGQLNLRSGVVEIPLQTNAQAIGALRSITQSSARHALIQFETPVEQATRNRLSAAGLHLQGYVGDLGFIIAIGEAGFDAGALTRLGVPFQIAPLQPQYKIHPLLADPEAPAPAHAVVGKDNQGNDIVGVYVLFHADVNVNEVAPAAMDRNGAVLRDVLESINGAVIELPTASVVSLSNEEDVLWIEPALPRFSTTNAENRALTQTNLVQSAPYNLDGTGVNVLVYDAGIASAGHLDFGGRLTTHDGSGVITHATHVAGTIGGSGAVEANERGMATAVTMKSYGFQHDGSGIFLYNNPGDIEADYDAAINQHSVDIANNSIGSNTETNGFPCSIQGDYGVTDALIDAIVRGSLGEPFRIVWANGNERQGSSCDIEGFGDYYSIAPPAGAKNHITVGATNANDDSMTSFSSWGPTDDGRMKPDVSAPGCEAGGDGGVRSCNSSGGYSVLCGTSMAAPTVTGCCALLLEDFRAHYPSLPDPLNSTLKILLAHTAMERGNIGPDHQFGYGSVRIKDAIDFMRMGYFLQSTVNQAQVAEFDVNVAPGATQLKATLAWDDPPGSSISISALVNDLDIVAIDPNGNPHLPWTLNPLNPGAPAVQTAANHRDNIEQVLVSNPMSGLWTIRVIGFNIPQGPQVFSLCASPELEVPATMFVLLPDGVPTTLEPGVTVDVPVNIAALGQSVVPGSPTMHVRYDGGAFLEIPLEHVSGNSYTATLPAPTCAATPEIYFSAEGDSTGVITNPPTAPADVYEATIGQNVSLTTENFEGGANGWVGGQPGDTATTGVWVQVNPNGTAAQPEDDHTPAPGVMCWVTGQGTPGGGVGDADVDGGFTTLLSPAFDATAATNPVLSYWRWYSNNAGSAPNTDTFLVDLSNNNGSSWINAQVIGPSGPGTSGGWLFSEINLSQFFTPTNQVRVRFIAQDLGAGSIVEAAIDDLAISSFQCTAVFDDCNENGIVDSSDIASGISQDINNNQIPDECEGPVCVGDTNGDNSVDVTDLLAVINAWGPCPAPCAADVDASGIVDVTDLLAVINAWGACP